MADRIAVTVGRYRGEYDLDIDEQPFTNLEWRWIKKISGYLPFTIGDGLTGRDPDVFLAFTIVAMARAGRISKDEALMVAEELDDLPVDGAAIRYISQEAETDSPPPETLVMPPPPRSTGGSSPPTSDLPEPHPKPIGAPA